jgi:hypothetical protein
VATLVARNVNEAIVVPMVGSGGVCVWQQLVRPSVLYWCVRKKRGFSRREDILRFNSLNKINFVSIVLSMPLEKLTLQ